MFWLNGKVLYTILWVPVNAQKQVLEEIRVDSYYITKKYSDRDTAIVIGYESGAYNMKEIGEYFDLSYSRISHNFNS